MTYQAILFDLDGTLLDTAEDLGAALNFVLRDKNFPPLTQEIIRPYAGQGARGLLKLALDIDTKHPEYHALAEAIFEYYADTMLQETKLFAGMHEILEHLEKKNIPWGIVTNKPHRFTSPILENLALHTRAACVVSGDTLPKAKPHPDTILHACELLNVTPDKCVYIGDSEVDVIASRAAGMDVVVAMYGYLPLEATPEKWEANGYISHPSELLNYL